MRIEPSDSIVHTVTVAGVVSNRPCIIQGVALSPAAASCTVLLYDPPVPLTESSTPTTTGAVLKVAMSGAAAGATANLAQSGSGIAFQNGCIAVIAGTGATATIIFAKI